MSNSKHDYVQTLKEKLLDSGHGGVSGREPTCQFRRRWKHSLTPGLGRSPGGGNGSPRQDSCLENPVEGGLVGYSPQGCKESETPEAT